jgi:hypothetical protein
MTDTTVTTIACTQCGCEIEYCSFCEGEDCAAACCYGCLVVELKESARILHTHGG